MIFKTFTLCNPTLFFAFIFQTKPPILFYLFIYLFINKGSSTYNKRHYLLILLLFFIFICVFLINYI